MDEDLLDFLSLEIPEPTITEDGFLEIIKKAHYENINSSIYAYFLQQSNNKKIAQVFYQALSDLIEQKIDKLIGLEDYYCETEVATQKGRIDIFINDTNNKKAILIENKIYHHLANDLMDYWEHCTYKNENKIGILLTLEKQNIPDLVKDYFINITHNEWINRIKVIGLPSGIPHKHYVYLNDFFQTIENLTKNNAMNEQALFYFQHTKKILKATETIKEANDFINNQLEILAEKLGLSTYGNNNGWRNLWNKEINSRTFYTIVYNQLLCGEKTIEIVIEIEKEDIPKADDLRLLLKDDAQYLSMELNGESNQHFIHFARKKYTLNLVEIQNFAKTVESLINSDFKAVMDKIMRHNYPE